MKHLSFIFTGLLSLCTIFVYTQEIPTIGEIYDYDIGDIFHINEWGNSPGDAFSANSNVEIIDKYYSNNSDTVFYRQFIKKVESSASFPNPTYTEYEETIYYSNLDQTINADSIVDDIENYNGRITVYKIHFSGSSYTENTFVVGCGNVNHKYVSNDPENQVHYEINLLYYKKGDEEWGNEHIVGVNEMQKEMLVSLSPNPAKNNLKVFLQEDLINSTINIFDLNGQLIWSDLTNSKTNDINVSSFQNGLYFIQQVNEDGIVVSKSKFLKI